MMRCNGTPRLRVGLPRDEDDFKFVIDHKVNGRPLLGPLGSTFCAPGLSPTPVNSLRSKAEWKNRACSRQEPSVLDLPPRRLPVQTVRDLTHEVRWAQPSGVRTLRRALGPEAVEVRVISSQPPTRPMLVEGDPA